MKYYSYTVNISGYYNPFNNNFWFSKKWIEGLFVADAVSVIAWYDVYDGYKASDLEIKSCGKFAIIIYPKGEPEKATIVSVVRKMEFD